ncbi:MAG: hypothetical protein LAO78_05605 [Acidobacteriia bacterium]|nr:hypothetical protein [Terriglobia bacterium]
MPLRFFRDFNGLHGEADLARQMPLLVEGISGATCRDFKIPRCWDQEFKMFDGKNNRILDSLSFRLALTAAVFAVWSGAGYILLAL